MSNEQQGQPTDDASGQAEDWLADLDKDERNASRWNAQVRWRNARALREVVGERVRTLRQNGDVRQEQLAEHARAVGLPWARSSVTTLEAGRRDLPLEEVVLLPSLLSQATGAPVTLADLIPDAAELKLGRLTVTGQQLRDALAGVAALPGPPEHGFLSEQGDLTDLRHRWPGLDREHLAAAATRPTQEPDQKAARKLSKDLGWEVRPQSVAVAAQALWGRTLAAHRDGLAGQTNLPDSRRGQQTALGHITRRLLTELATELRAAEARAATATATTAIAQGRDEHGAR